MREIDRPEQLVAALESRTSLRGSRFQDLDLTAHRALLLERTDYGGVVVLGGRIDAELEVHVRSHGAIVFPATHGAPVDPYRSRLYSPAELYAGVTESGYATTPDARAYRWARDASLAHDPYVGVLRALHDEAMADALGELLDGLPTVGIMGGHAAQRGSAAFADAARLGHSLADAGLVVLTGGGPGAMEAANLGALAPTLASLESALVDLARVPSYRPDISAWADLALTVRSTVTTGHSPDGRPRPRSVGIPTWFYGHEPPNVFCDAIAKYFSNALREDTLLARSSQGIVVLPGAAGTVQEIFQAATALYYAPEDGPLPPLILVGIEHWTHTVPLWPALTALGVGRGMGGAIHLVDQVHEAALLVRGE